MISNFNNINFNFLKKNSFFEIYIIIAYSCLFFSVGENIVNISFDQNLLKFENIFYIRSVTPYIILFINLIIILNNRINNIFKKNNIILFFYLIIFSQALGLYLSINRDYLALSHFLIGSLATLTTFNIITSIGNEKIFKQIISLTIFFFLLIVFIFIFQNPNISYGGGAVNFFGKQIYFLNSNGFSRYLVFIYILIISNYFLSKKVFNLKLLFFLVSIASLIITYEGRVNILSVLIINMFIFIQPIKFKNKISILLILIFIPLILSNSLKNIRDSNFKIFDSGLNLHKLIQLNQSTKRELNPEGDNAMLKGYIESMSNSVNNFSTGRFEKWKSIVSYKQKITNYIFGNGPEFDRWILIGSYEHHLNDAASSILYLYLCGGILSLIILLIFIIYQLYLFYFALRHTKDNKDIYFLISLKIFIFICFRSLFENSYASWSIDQIVFILSGIYWNNYIIKKT